MKTKLFLILTILIFAYSCNSPSNPTKASNNQSNISNSIENNAMHDIAKLNSNAAKIGEPNIEDNYKPLAVYEGNGKYRINGVDFPNDENLKIEIYDDGSIDVIRTKNISDLNVLIKVKRIYIKAKNIIMAINIH